MQMSPYQQFIHVSRYARYLWDKHRRETWDETVNRYFNFFTEHLHTNYSFNLDSNTREQLQNSVYELSVMPSMRCLMTAGPALERENMAAFNCSYTVVDRPRAFDEILYILMNGTGVGFSVERKYVDRLPEIAEEFHKTDTTVVVADSKMGWAKALKELISLLYSGQVPNIDVSRVRPAGSPLKTFGGRASGPEPLTELFNFVIAIFKKAKGRRLTTQEAHDIVCKIAQVVVVGGVRRSALISISDLEDDLMRYAKHGDFGKINPQRYLANNSAVYEEMPDMGAFMREWLSLYESKSGERGIFNRAASQSKAFENGRREPHHLFGTNPCGEIILRPRGLCNLTESVIRPDDTLESLEEKVRIATILGTFQSTLTNFRYVSKVWSENAIEERLLGVSLTGIMDHYTMSGMGNDHDTLKKWLRRLKHVAIQTNEEWAEKLGINPSAAITTVKPSGTVSQLVDASPGIHARHSPFYIRNVRADKKDPLAKMMIDKGFPYEDDVTNPEHNYVFPFPVESPNHSICRDDLTAISHLETWKTYRDFWCEHNPSATITVRENEWMEVGAWVYENFESVGGLSFLPHSDFVYKQVPYQECSREEYESLKETIPENVDWTDLQNYERTDETKGSQELACASGVCEI